MDLEKFLVNAQQAPRSTRQLGYFVMRSGLLLLAALPSALAAAFAHSAVRAAHHRSLGGENCLLPSSYTIQHFKARKTKTGTTISQFDFTYLDNMTNVTTLCQYNSSSVTFTPAEGAPRYSCRNRNVEFIWQGDSRMIWMGEKICPSSNG